MFGLIVSGQLVKTDFQQVGEKQFLNVINDAQTINHIVVFLTGTVPFPEGTGGLVYFSFPDPINAPAWHLLGFISNEKPSAIFKVANLKTAQTHLNADGTQFVFGLGSVSINAQIGIAIDSIAGIQQQFPNGLVNASGDGAQGDIEILFCQKILENLYNFVASFALTQNEMVPNPAETFVPLSSLQTWYNNIQRRLRNHPNFWKE